MERFSEHIQHAITNLVEARKGAGTIKSAMERCAVHHSREHARQHLDQFPADFMVMAVDLWSAR